MSTENISTLKNEIEDPFPPAQRPSMSGTESHESQVDLAPEDTILKRSSRELESYILQILKNISPDNSMKNSAKFQFNSILKNLSQSLSEKILFLNTNSSTKTIDTKTVKNTIQIISTQDFFEKIDSFSTSILQNFNNNKSPDQKKFISRQKKADIVFPPSFFEKIIRKHSSKTHINKEAPIYITAFMEFLCKDILLISSQICSENLKKRLSIRDIFIAINTTEHLKYIFNSLNVKFLGTGVVPSVQHDLYNDKSIRKKNIIKQIRKYQHSSSLIFSKTPFERIVRNKVLSYSENIKISKEVFNILQTYIEQKLTDFFKKVFLIISANGRIKAVSNDLYLVCSLENINIERRDIELLSLASNLEDTDLESNIDNDSNVDYETDSENDSD